MRKPDAAPCAQHTPRVVRRIVSRSRFLASAGLVAALLAGCSTVPNAGPSRQTVLDVAARTDAPFLIAPISDFAIQKLQSFPGPSLYGKFGDYRPPVEQKLGVGDYVSITVFEAAAGGLFSQPVSTANSTGSHSATVPSQIVQRDGTITVPYAGRIDVAGKTIPQVEALIVEKLTGKAIEPQAIVTLDRSISQSISVTGEVTQGARVPLSARGDKLLDVIATVGGITKPASETFIDLSRGRSTVRVPFQTLLNTPRENIYARPGDVLTVVDYPLTFTAIGATNRNAVVPFDAVGISLEEAVAKAAGLIDDRVDPEGVFVFRYEPISVVKDFPGLSPQLAALNLVPTAYIINMRDPASLFLARRFPMHDKDIVYVSNSPFNDLQKLLGLISTVAAPAVTIGAVAVGFP